MNRNDNKKYGRFSRSDGTMSIPSSSCAAPRFLVIKAKEGDFSLVSPFVIDKHIRNSIGDVKSVRKIYDGLLVETANAAQSLRLLKLSKFYNRNIEVVPHTNLNYCKGVVSCRDLTNCSVEEITSGLESEGVINVRRISILRDKQRIDTASYILTFNTPDLPGRVKAGFHSLPVRPYIPAPLRCFRCQKYGHTSTRCNYSAICVCGSQLHEGSPCSAPLSCPNCSGNHVAVSKSCPVYKEEMEIQRIKTLERIPYHEAKLRIKPTLPKAKSFADVAASTSATINVKRLAAELVPEIISLLQLQRETFVCNLSKETEALELNKINTLSKDGSLRNQNFRSLPLQRTSTPLQAEKNDSEINANNLDASVDSIMQDIERERSVSKNLSDISITSVSKTREMTDSSGDDRPPKKKPTRYIATDKTKESTSNLQRGEYNDDMETDQEIFSTTLQQNISAAKHGHHLKTSKTRQKKGN